MLVPVPSSEEHGTVAPDVGRTRHCDGAGPCKDGLAGGKLTWRTNVAASRPHWETWYHGLPHLFLACQAPKALVLSKRGPLDKELERAAMQGKFQLEHVPQACFSSSGAPWQNATVTVACSAASDANLHQFDLGNLLGHHLRRCRKTPHYAAQRCCLWTTILRAVVQAVCLVSLGRAEVLRLHPCCVGGLCSS